MKAVYLTPLSSLKTDLRSDTLWGILMVAIRYVLGESKAEEIAQAYLRGQPPFVISSAMKFTTDSGVRTCWFPRPIVHPPRVTVNTEEDLTRHKMAKSQRVLPQDRWEQFITGEISELQIIEQLTAEATDQNKTMPHFETQDVLHIAVDRMSGGTLELEGTGQLFYTDEGFVREGGFYFLVEGESGLIEPALRYLEHVGFGGDRSTGKGKCTVQIEDFELRTPPQPTHMVTLSVYSPAEDELFYYRDHPERLWYELELRTGRLSPSLAFGAPAPPEKSSVVVFAEGSTFPWLSKDSYGSVRTVARWGNTNVLFNGFALMIPACFQEES